MKKTVILTGVRTPIGSFMGTLSAMPATSLGSTVISAAVKKSGVALDDIEH